MHSHQKKASLKRTKLMNLSHCDSSFQISAYRLNTVLNSVHRKCARQSAEFCKKETSSQMKSMMSSQKVFLRENRNFRVSSHDAQAAQRTIQSLKLYYSSTVNRQDRASSISTSKKSSELLLLCLLL